MYSCCILAWCCCFVPGLCSYKIKNKFSMYDKKNSSDFRKDFRRLSHWKKVSSPTSLSNQSIYYFFLLSITWPLFISSMITIRRVKGTQKCDGKQVIFQPHRPACSPVLTCPLSALLNHTLVLSKVWAFPFNCRQKCPWKDPLYVVDFLNLQFFTFRLLVSFCLCLQNLELIGNLERWVF